MTSIEIIKFELDKSKFQHHGGKCWKIKLPDGAMPTVTICHNMKSITIPCLLPPTLTKYFDQDAKKPTSTAILYENGIGLENKHSAISDIVNNGSSRYLFLIDTLYFSSKTSTVSSNNYHVVIFTKGSITNDQFTFGVNWLDYVTHSVTDTVVEAAGKYIDDWFGPNAIANKTVIDVGSGSGLSSLCFMKRQAKQVVSFDVDANCVLASEKLAAMHYPEGKPAKWTIKLGSVMDNQFVSSLGQFDIVHSWGVLHHTGHMYQAIENTIKLVKPGGLMLISLYAGIKNYATDKQMKETYNKADKYGKMNYIADYVMLIRKWRRDAGENPHEWNTLQPTRGMNKYNDVVDWLGGLPYEVTDTATITKFCADRGLKLLRKFDPVSKACHEWLFQRA